MPPGHACRPGRAASTTPASPSSGWPSATASPRAAAPTGSPSASRRRRQDLRGEPRDPQPEPRLRRVHQGPRETVRPTPTTRDLELLVEDIEVPVFLTGAWQDEQTGPRFGAHARQLHRHRPGAVHPVQRPPPRRLHAAGADPLVRVPRALRRRAGPAHHPTASAAPPRRSSRTSSASPASSSSPTASPTSPTTTSRACGRPTRPSPRCGSCSRTALAPRSRRPVATFEATFDEWPPPDATPATWYLGADGTLVDDAPDGDGADPSRSTSRPARTPSSRTTAATTRCCPRCGTRTGPASPPATSCGICPSRSPGTPACSRGRATPDLCTWPPTSRT